MDDNQKYSISQGNSPVRSKLSSKMIRLKFEVIRKDSLPFLNKNFQE